MRKIPILIELNNISMLRKKLDNRVLVITFSSCSSNIEHIKPSDEPVGKQKTYNAPFEKVWSAAQRTLSENNTFKILDKSSGIMVTEHRTIDANELSLAQTYFLGKTYKSNYTVNFLQNGTDITDVNVNIRLEAVQIVLLAREEKNEIVENYLRKDLFDKISSNLSLVGTAPTHETTPIKNQNNIEKQNMVEQSPEMTIAEMQQRLLDLGYQPGPADGILGKRTIDALKKYQRDNNLSVTGKLDNKTIINLLK